MTPKHTVTVNDKMQKGYRYVLTAPAGRGSPADQALEDDPPPRCANP
jgi:hypothetical protein